MPGNVYLCGPPGSGKSAVGPLLAALRSSAHADVDVIVEREAGESIASLFGRLGESAFRAREREVVATLARRRDLVVSLGGGALEDPHSRALLEQTGTLVFLDASVEVCRANIARDEAIRPLLAAPGALERLHGARRPTYRRAAIHVRVDGLQPADVARRVHEELTRERIVHVATDAPYDVAIGPASIERLPERAAAGGGNVFVLGDENVAALAQRVAERYRETGARVTLELVTAGEEVKSFERLLPLYGRFGEAGIDRRGLIVAVGGGTLADVTGFAASTYHRGVRYAIVATTLLAGVDAAIGGKTAVNLPAGKNLVGTIVQPVHVAVATCSLRTLPERELLSGYGEMLKYGLALDEALYDNLVRTEREILEDPGSGVDAIERCVAHKARLVAQDEDDRRGIREVLNFGHTVGHALERECGYGELRHGEAVIVGMRVAVELSLARGLLDANVARRLDAHLHALPVPAVWRDVSADAVLRAASSDKKRASSGYRFVLLEGLGHARSFDGIDRDALRSAFERVRAA